MYLFSSSLYLHLMIAFVGHSLSSGLRFALVHQEADSFCTHSLCDTHAIEFFDIFLFIYIFTFDLV